MRTNWRSYKSLPLEVRQSLYERNIDDEIENWRQFEKALRDTEEPEEEIEKEEDLEFTEKSNGKITIIKGDDPEMKNLEELIIEFLGENDLPVEFEKAQKVLPEKARKALKEAFGVLNKYKESLDKDLLEAIKVLGKYVGYGYPYPEPYPTKKGLEKREPVSWLTVRNQFFGKLEKSDEKEISKSDVTESDPFPSLSKRFKRNDELIDEIIEENNIESGERFL